MTLSFATMTAIAFTWLALGDVHASAAAMAETPVNISSTHQHAAFPARLSVAVGSRWAKPHAGGSEPRFRLSQYRETLPQPQRGGGGSAGPSETDTGTYRPDRGSTERGSGADRWDVHPIDPTQPPTNPCLVFPDDYPCTDKKKVR